MKGDFEPRKKKESPAAQLTHDRMSFAEISGKLAGACDQMQRAAKLAAETAERARTILCTTELRAYLIAGEVATLEGMAGRAEAAATALRADYAPLYAIEQRVRRIGTTEDVPSSGHSPASVKKKSLAAAAALPRRAVGRKDSRK